MGKFEKFKAGLGDALGVFENRTIDPHEVVDAEESESLEAKVELAKETATVIARLEDCTTAQKVFQDFAPDAARGKVMEMVVARSSADRQRAQDTVLNYALGKPVERVMTMHMDVPNMTEGELDHEIRQRMSSLGFKGGERKTSTLLVEPRGEGESSPTSEVRAEPKPDTGGAGGAGEVHTESSSD